MTNGVSPSCALLPSLAATLEAQLNGLAYDSLPRLDGYRHSLV